MLLYPEGDGMGAGSGAGEPTGADAGAQGAQGAGGTKQPAADGESFRSAHDNDRDGVWNAWLGKKGDEGALNALRRFAAAHGMTLAEAKAEIKAEAAGANQAKPQDPEGDEMRTWWRGEKQRREAEAFDAQLQGEVHQAIGQNPLTKDPDIGEVFRDYVAGMRLLRPDLSQRQIYAMAPKHFETMLGKYVARVGGKRSAASAVTPIRGGASPGGSKRPFDPSKTSFAQLAEQTAAQLDE